MTVSYGSQTCMCNRVNESDFLRGKKTKYSDYNK